MVPLLSHRRLLATCPNHHAFGCESVADNHAAHQDRKMSDHELCLPRRPYAEFGGEAAPEKGIQPNSCGISVFAYCSLLFQRLWQKEGNNTVLACLCMGP